MKDVKPLKFTRDNYGGNQRGYQEWWMFHVPSVPGYTKWGYNNWWVYIANTDEDLPYMQSYDYKEDLFEPAGE